MKRPRIGSKSTALIATLTVLIGSSIIADRLGAPAAIIAPAMLGLSAVGVVLAGVTTRTMRLTTFRQAGLRLGWTRGGGTQLVLILAVALLIGQNPARDLAIAAAAALAAAALYALPLRRAATPSLGGFAYARYRSRAIAAATGLAAVMLGLAFALLSGLKGLALLHAIPTLPHGVAPVAFVAVGLSAILPGGLASLAATAVVAAFLVLVATLLPAAFALGAAPNLPAPLLSASAELARIDLDERGAALALASAGLIAFAGVSAAMRKPSHVLRVPAGAVLAAGLIGAALTVTAQRTPTLLPNGLEALTQIAPALALTIAMGLALRFAAAGLVDDVFYRLSGFSGTASGRLALHRAISTAVILWISTGPIIALPPSAREGLMMIAALWPAVVVLPALLPSADWRTPAAGLAVLTAVATAIALEAWAFGPWLAATAVLAATTLAAIAWQSRDRGQSRRAAILRGAIVEPIIEETDA